MDPAGDGVKIRGRLGVVPQQDTLDMELTVRENIIIYGRYFCIPRKQLRGPAYQLEPPLSRATCDLRRRAVDSSSWRMTAPPANRLRAMLLWARARARAAGPRSAPRPAGAAPRLRDGLVKVR